MVEDLGRDLGGIGCAPVVVRQGDGGVRIAYGDDAVRGDIAEIVRGNVDGRAAVDRELGGERRKLNGVGRTGIQVNLIEGRGEEAVAGLEVAAAADGDQAGVLEAGGGEGRAGWR